MKQTFLKIPFQLLEDILLPMLFQDVHLRIVQIDMNGFVEVSMLYSKSQTEQVEEVKEVLQKRMSQ